MTHSRYRSSTLLFITSKKGNPISTRNFENIYWFEKDFFIKKRY